MYKYMSENYKDDWLFFLFVVSYYSQSAIPKLRHYNYKQLTLEELEKIKTCCEDRGYTSSFYQDIYDKATS